MHILNRQATHSGDLERWLTRPEVERISLSMKDWYGPPIAVAGVPGKVFVTKGGDFRGPITMGRFGSAMDRLEDWGAKRYQGFRRAARSKQLNTGFASLSDIITEASAGKARHFYWTKTGSTGVVGVTNSLWRNGPQPAAGAAPAAAPGGTAQTDATTGAYAFTNPTGGDTQHFVKGEVLADRTGTLLLYDLIFGVAKTINSTATEAVTGVPTRYQNTTAGNPDSIAGNFGFVQVGGTALAATAHNWTVCTYLDQANAASTLPSLTGNSAAIVDRLDHPVQQWFAPLESGDTGIKAWTQMQCSALVATGVIWFMIGHPIAMMPHPILNVMCLTDGIMTAFNLVQVFDDACLALLELIKPATNATNYNVKVMTVAG